MTVRKYIQISTFEHMCATSVQCVDKAETIFFKMCHTSTQIECSVIEVNIHMRVGSIFRPRGRCLRSELWQSALSLASADLARSQGAEVYGNFLLRTWPLLSIDSMLSLSLSLM
ncbi:hypothetical protein TNCT_436471 [Trichonephila clavata]|uniref:Uncharacterized protein n=1 Tax=Trichonephila clavata TaxID=2740835 RepID=A0A8X6HFV7_TRICU|nr:hypothetical protein TNCT_436471 [Trichonephila clavata]